MSLFKKLFGRNPSEPSLGPLPPRPPRVVLNDFHRVFFALKRSDGVSVPLHVVNLSVGGMALPRIAVEGADVGLGFDGRLAVDTVDFPVSCRVRHVSENNLGCEFIDSHPDLRRAIESYLRVEILALKFRRIDSSVLKADPRGETLWFTDGGTNELHAVRDAQGLVEFHVTFLGNYLEGGRGKSLRGGFIQASTSEKTFAFKGSDLLDLKPVEPEMLALVHGLITRLDALPGDLRAEIVGHLRVV